MANSCKFILICTEKRYRSYMVLPVAKCAGYVVFPRCFDVDTWFCLPSLSNMAADGAKFYNRICAFKLRFQICKNIKITQNVTYMVLPCDIKSYNIYFIGYLLLFVIFNFLFYPQPFTFHDAQKSNAKTG